MHLFCLACWLCQLPVASSAAARAMIRRMEGNQGHGKREKNLITWVGLAPVHIRILGVWNEHQ